MTADPRPLTYSKAVRRCGACGGLPREVVVNGEIYQTAPCPDCADGWAEVDVAVECGNSRHCTCSDPAYCGRHHASSCPHCNGSSRVPAPWAIVCVGDRVRWGDEFRYVAELTADEWNGHPEVTATLTPDDSPGLGVDWEEEPEASWIRIADLALDLSALAEDQRHRHPVNRWNGEVS